VKGTKNDSCFVFIIEFILLNHLSLFISE